MSAGLSHTPCLLALEDGRTFLGIGFGHPGTVTGELVFNTSMTGYQEILTDPSYAGQVVTLTYPEIGNYGTNQGDLESKKVFARGLVIRHLSRRHSNWRASHSLPQFLAQHKVLGIYDVDTRAITKHIRDKGAMRCAISTEILDPAELIAVAQNSPQMTGADYTREVTTPETFKMEPATGSKPKSPPYKVAVMDFGVKQSILDNLSKQGFELTVFPATAKAKDILATKPDALFLSNGPGDPAACTDVLAELPALLEARLPTFGICLGHQLLALAFGATTYKLKFGHRGGNQPVMDMTTGKVEITCQNHGFAVDESSLPEDLELTHINLNDKSVEGFKHKHLPVFCVQYHPESSPGPSDANYLFERFKNLIETQKVGV